MAAKAGMTLEDAANKVEVPGHSGPHPEAYHKAVYTRLEKATGEVHHVGRVLDFCLTTFAAPIATSALAEAVQSVAGADVQCIPVTISGQTGMYVLNCLRVIRCLDESKSEFLKWTEQDHRADLAGQYRQVTKLVLERSPIPIGAHFFRIKDWDVALIVSETVKNAMERVGCYGAEFTELEMA